MANFQKGDNMENMLARLVTRLPFLAILFAFFLSACGGENIELPEDYDGTTILIYHPNPGEGQSHWVPFGPDQCSEYYQGWIEKTGTWEADTAMCYYHDTWYQWPEFCKGQHYILEDSCPKPAAAKKAADCPKCPDVGSALPGSYAPATSGWAHGGGEGTVPWPR